MRAYLASLTWSSIGRIVGSFMRNRQYEGFSDHLNNDIVRRHPIMKKGMKTDTRHAGLPTSSAFGFLTWDVTTGFKKLTSKPRLKIRSINQTKDVIIWKHHITAWKRKFITVKIENKRVKTAVRCSAKLAFTKLPPKVSHLKKKYNLRWIGANQSIQGDDSGSIYITKGSRRLEIVFSDSDEAAAGCWISCVEAFSDTAKDKVFLPPGVYHAVLMVTCENGKGDIRKYRIESPKNWQHLRVVEMK